MYRPAGKVVTTYYILRSSPPFAESGGPIEASDAYQGARTMHLPLVTEGPVRRHLVAGFGQSVCGQLKA